MLIELAGQGPIVQVVAEVVKWAAAIDDRIEPQTLTPDRFGPNDPLASEIFRSGVRLM